MSNPYEAPGSFFGSVARAFSPRRNLRDLFVAKPGQQGHLDGLRAISILWMMTAHVHMFSAFMSPESVKRASPALVYLLSQGNLAVSVFFALSGFLVGRILLEELRKGDIALGRFTLSRLLRLAPAYYAALLLYPPICAPQSTAADLFPYLTYWANYRMGTRAIMGQAWSLCIEEQFYVVLPAMLLLTRNWSRRALAGLLVAFGVVSLAIPVIAMRGLALPLAPIDGWTVDPAVITYSQKFYYPTHTRAAELFAGVLGAIATTRFRHLVEAYPKKPGVLLGIAAVLMVVALSVSPEMAIAESVRPLLAMQHVFVAIATTLVLVYGERREESLLARRVLGSPVFRPFARLSYSAYLMNMIAAIMGSFAFTYKGGDANVFLLKTALVHFGATFFLALILYLFVEAPSLEFRRRVLAWRGRAAGLPMAQPNA